MAQVTVTVNNRGYTLACDDGEEAHLIHLALEMDKRVAGLVRGAAQPTSDAARLILMAALTLADELALANERIAEIEEELAGLKDDGAKAANPPPKNINGAPFDEEKFAGILESAARRMEDIAGRLD